MKSKKAQEFIEKSSDEAFQFVHTEIEVFVISEIDAKLAVEHAEREMIEKLKKGYCKNCDITLNYATCTENQMCNSLKQIINLLN